MLVIFFNSLNARKLKKQYVQSDQGIFYYSKTCLKWSLKKKDKTKVFKTIRSLMKVGSIAECSLGAFCNTFDLH